MIRIRALVFFLPLIVLSQASQAVLAAPPAPASAWKPGTYLGTITIKAKDHHPTPKDMEGKEEYTLYIPETRGKLQIQINSKGAIQFQFSIPISFTQADWAEVPDDGQGQNCRGMISDSHGSASLDYRGAPTLLPVGDTFSTQGSPKISQIVFGKPTVWHIGPNCDETDEKDLKKAIDLGLKVTFQNTYDFYANPPKGGRIGGICTMMEWENDPERKFTCTWSVNGVPKKK